MVYDDVTGEAGLQIAAIAGTTIAKWNVLSYIQGGTNLQVSPTPISGNENDMPMGVAYAAATAGNPVWVWVSGICQVLPEAGVTATLGYIITTSATTAGTIVQAATAPAAATHFKEIGHFAESGSWAWALALATIHFN
jgi:hypothetical protein